MDSRWVGNETRLVAIALALATLVLYAWRLADSPIHLHYDEIFFGLQAHSIQSTGRDLNGRWWPVYFQLENTFNWYQPMAVYWSAAVLSILPLSDAAVRVPAVLVAVANVVLMFVLAKRLTNSTQWGAVAAVLLMLTPAHFIHSRLAMDYVYPLPFILAWLLLIKRYLDRPSARVIALAGVSLGLGFFSYIAGTALTPIYLIATVVVVLWRRQPMAHAGVVIAGFALPVIAAALFMLVHPETVPDLLQKYGYGQVAAADGFDPLQRLREAVNARTVSDALNHYWRFFSPGYLFVSGGANLTNSTRAAGVFLWPIAIPLVVGLLSSIRQGGTLNALLWFGLLTAPVPATLMPEDYTIDRELAVLPFVILFVTRGLRSMWHQPLARKVAPLTMPAAAIAGAIAVAYAVFTLAQRGQMSRSAPLLLVAAAVVWAIGFALDRMASWRPAAAMMLVLIPVIFTPFLVDYFEGYRLRASAWFGGNMRGAMEELVRLDRESPAQEIRLSTDVPYVRSYWRFYLTMWNRTDLLAKTKEFDARSLGSIALPANAYLLSAATDAATTALAGRQALVRISGAGDAPGAPEQFTIYRVPARP